MTGQTALQTIGQTQKVGARPSDRWERLTAQSKAKGGKVRQEAVVGGSWIQNGREGPCVWWVGVLRALCGNVRV
jgi:hypothetical protein